MLAYALLNLSPLIAAADVRGMGHDYMLSLIAATFPGWALFTLVRGWWRPGLAAAAACRG